MGQIKLSIIPGTIINLFFVSYFFFPWREGGGGRVIEIGRTLPTILKSHQIPPFQSPEAAAKRQATVPAAKIVRREADDCGGGGGDDCGADGWGGGGGDGPPKSEANCLGTITDDASRAYWP